MTKVPLTAWEKSSPGGREEQLDHLAQEVSVLRKMNSASKRKIEEEMPHDEKKHEDGGGSSTRVKLDESPQARTPRNSKGAPIPRASPDDLLTGERDGSELAKILVSPVSLGRTARLLRSQSTTERCE